MENTYCVKFLKAFGKYSTADVARLDQPTARAYLGAEVVTLWDPIKGAATTDWKVAEKMPRRSRPEGFLVGPGGGEVHLKKYQDLESRLDEMTRTLEKLAKAEEAKK